jgi:polysaccharide biosynthesis transport protein
VFNHEETPVTHRRGDGGHSEHDLVLEAWQRRKWLALAMFVIAAAAAAGVAVSLPDLYHAKASVLVARQQVSEAFVRQSVTAELETRIHVIHQQVMSRARLTDVIQRLDLYPDLRAEVPFDAVVERMRRDVQLDLKGVEQTTGRAATIAFTLGYTGRDPVQVAEVANTLVALYVEENTKSRERQASSTAEFLKEQLSGVKQHLDAQEQRVSAFKAQHTAELPEQVEANLAALERLNTQLRLNGEYRLRALERRERLEKQVADSRTTQAPAATVSTPVTQLATRRQELANLRRRYSERYPDVIRVQEEIAALERQVSTADADTTSKLPSAEAAAPPAQPLNEIQAELASLREEEGFLRQVIAGYESRVESAPKRQQELQELSRDYDTTKQRYESLLKQYEDAQLAASLEQGQSVEQLQILDPAVPPMMPSAPNRVWVFLMGLLASVGLAFGTIVAAEKLDTTFHTVDDLRAFASVPTLATIRLILTPADIRRQRWRMALLTAALVAGVGLVAAGSYYVADGNEQLVRLTARGA